MKRKIAIILCLLIVSLSQNIFSQDMEMIDYIDGLDSSKIKVFIKEKNSNEYKTLYCKVILYNTQMSQYEIIAPWIKGGNVSFKSCEIQDIRHIVVK